MDYQFSYSINIHVILSIFLHHHTQNMTLLPVFSSSTGFGTHFEGLGK